MFRIFLLEIRLIFFFSQKNTRPPMTGDHHRRWLRPDCKERTDLIRATHRQQRRMDKLKLILTALARTHNGAESVRSSTFFFFFFQVDGPFRLHETGEHATPRDPNVKKQMITPQAGRESRLNQSAAFSQRCCSSPSLCFQVSTVMQSIGRTAAVVCMLTLAHSIQIISPPKVPTEIDEILVGRFMQIVFTWQILNVGPVFISFRPVAASRSGPLVGQFPTQILRALETTFKTRLRPSLLIASICLCCAHNVSINLFASFDIATFRSNVK
jgi:hypothetical protein